jgi:hypothetical protein
MYILLRASKLKGNARVRNGPGVQYTRYLMRTDQKAADERTQSQSLARVYSQTVKIQRQQNSRVLAMQPLEEGLIG